MNVDSWLLIEKRKAKKKTAIKALEVIETIVHDKPGPAFLKGRVKMCEVDDGIAISWIKGTTPRHLLLTVATKGDYKNDFVILERGVDTYPRGSVDRLDKIFAVLDNDLKGTPAAQARAHSRLMAGGNIEQTRIANEREQERARKRAEKAAKKQAASQKVKKKKAAKK